MQKKTITVTERHASILQEIKTNKGTPINEMIRRILDEFCDKYEQENKITK